MTVTTVPDTREKRTARAMEIQRDLADGMFRSRRLRTINVMFDGTLLRDLNSEIRLLGRDDSGRELDIAFTGIRAEMCRGGLLAPSTAAGKAAAPVQLRITGAWAPRKWRNAEGGLETRHTIHVAEATWVRSGEIFTLGWMPRSHG